MYFNNEANQKVVQSIHEGIEGLKELRIIGKEAYFLKRLEQGAKSIAYYATRQQLLNFAPGYMLEFVLVAFIVSILSISVWMGQELNSVIPTIGVFGVAALRLKPTANSLTNSLVTLRFQRDSISRLIKDLQFANSFKISKSRNYNAPKSLTFENLSITEIDFSYPGMARPAIKNVSLRIQNGEAIGLMGTSGSGKTTFIDILLGLLEPQSGKLEFNGRSFYENLEEWRSHVAYLPQEVFLIDNSLRCNVALGEEVYEKIDDKRLMEALYQAPS